MTPATSAQLQQVSDRCYAVFTRTARLTSGVIVSPGVTVVIDTGSGPHQGAQILTAARSLADQHLVVINTHAHWDHWFGNSTFAAAGCEQFYASTHFPAPDASLTEQLRYIAAEYEPDLATAALPTQPTALVDSPTPLPHDPSVTLATLPGHTDHDLIVICDDVIFTGDLVEEGADPQPDTGTKTQWLHALNWLLDQPNAAHFIPGHGAPVQPDFIHAQRHWLDTQSW